MSLIEFLLRNRQEVVTLTMEHLFLVAVSTGVAVLIGVPLGIVLTRKPGLSKPILGFANIMQTVPSLALFGFLIPLNLYLFHVRILGGIGAQTAIVALVLYALLPIIRNTFTGINGVDPAIREAGRGMGMTDRQLLFQVELPLALGVILAGVRVATVICVGTATIAAAIDAGGLGRYIFRGLRMNDNVLILAGAVPAALIALTADVILGYAERAIRTSTAVGKRFNRIVWASAGTLAILAIAGLIVFYAGKDSDRIAVGSKDFTEQIILGELLAETIEAKLNLPVERRFDLGGNLAHEALVAGEIDMYVEYTGTALLAILKGRPSADPEEVYRRVKSEYANRFGLEWMEPLGFNNTFAILVRGEDARRLNLKTISDAAKVSGQWRAGFGQDFMSRPDGYPGFARTYGFHFAETREMDLSLTYRALAEGQVDLIAGNSTDGLINYYGLVQLADDRRYFPPYDAVPVVRRATLTKYPELREVLRKLGGVLTVEEMRKLNYSVDGEKRAPKDVVREFLLQKGLIDEKDLAKQN
ncbi:MAG TPA: glycine betaine ABC transporter substrate-binding protein [Candidatus Binatia bacterium]|nr:glycine betaine ABC transporter substrate-binding protein [Candidatus Binatia bacterium]